jgi:DNA polymerase
MCKPRKLRKDEIKQWCIDNDWKGRAPGNDNPVLPTIYHGDLPGEEDDIYRNWAYCEQDIIAEEGLSKALPPLGDFELEVWQMDQMMNERGVKFDIEMANAAIELFNEYKGILNRKLFQITGILGGSKRAQVKAWLLEHEDVDLPDTKGETIDWLLKYKADEFSGRATQVMEIMRAVNRTSTAKYQTMIDKADPNDWRVRDLLMYWGGHTGRWAGKGVQIQNFPARDLIIKDFEEAAELIKGKDIEWCLVLYDDIIKLVSHALRGAIIPDTDLELMVADYSAIEARVVLWLAEATSALDIFRSGGDIYCDMATGIYGYQVQKSVHLMERQFGKQSILGLGYGMGFVTFLLTCRKYDIVFSEEDVIRIMGKPAYRKAVSWVRKYLFMNNDISPEQTKDVNGRLQAANVRDRLIEARLDPEAVIHELALMKHTVNVYRDRYPEVKSMWKDQEAAAIKAVQDWTKKVVDKAHKEHPEWVTQLSMTTKQRKKAGIRLPIKARRFRDNIEGPTITYGKIKWVVQGGWLHCVLPSGRPIRYRDPEVSTVTTSWGEKRPHLSYMHVDAKSKRWVRTGTYGGKLVENITQAVARDIMAWAMVLTSRGNTYATIMSVHDELVCEVRRNNGSIKGFEALMSSIPGWAEGCPITAEAERMGRYKK